MKSQGGASSNEVPGGCSQVMKSQGGASSNEVPGGCSQVMKSQGVKRLK